MKISLAVIILALSPGALFAVSGVIPVDEMVHYADLVAVCEVVRYDGPLMPPSRQHKRVKEFSKDIKVKLIKMLIGTENDTDLLVDWVDWSSDNNIKEGKEYVVFLRRWDKNFIDKPAISDRRIEFDGVEINHNYERFISEYWIREIIDGKIAWINNQKIGIDEFAKVIQNQRKRPLAKTNIYKRYYKRFLRYWCGSPHFVPATILVVAGVIFVVLRRKISAGLNAVSVRIWHSERANIVQPSNPQIMATPTIWIALGAAWILTGVILFFI